MISDGERLDGAKKSSVGKRQQNQMEKGYMNVKKGAHGRRRLRSSWRCRRGRGTRKNS